jgi:glycosyltransferase involved in cell wall biosynthesis
MAHEKQMRIVFASVLKPVNDTRMFGKLARGLAGHEVHVIGQQAGNATPSAGIILHPLPKMTRFSFERIMAPWRVLALVMQLKPNLFIITTHELLWIALLSKLTTRCKVIYDVQENYFYNILYTATFPRIVKPIMAFYVRMKELIAAPFIDHFVLAEKAYEAELPFLRKSYTVIENKVVRPDAKDLVPRKTVIRKLVFTGTLAPTTGVFTAIEIAKGLHEIDPEITLSIVGYCPQTSVLAEVQKLCRDLPFITLVGGESLVPHQTILQAIANADAGIISYPENPSTKTSIPTKLYEYLGYRLPIILNKSASLIELCEPFNAAVIYSEGQFTTLHQRLQHHVFYTHKPEFVYWEHELERFRRLTLQYLSN